jgi:hypothetical protein
MTHAHTLTRHRDIQAWVSDHKGMPAMQAQHTAFGEFRARLALKFDRPARPRGMPAVDQGASPISWSAWLAELDRQQLVLRVFDGEAAEYELIDRKSLN